MNKVKAKKIRAERRHKRVRSKVFGTEQRPRLSVHRSLVHISVQLINDEVGKTLLSVSDKGLDAKKFKTKTDKAIEVGKMIAEKAKAEKITQAVFDRGSFRYHGRVKALADSARENGLII